MHPTKPDKNPSVVKRKICTLVTSKEICFSAEDVFTAIKTAEASTAIGPDGFKHLGMKGLEYLTKTYNICMNSLEMPTMWKLGKTIPVPKPGQSLHEASSYRPITLLSPVVTVLEALVLSFLKNSLHQHGSLWPLCELSTTIADVLNSKRPHVRNSQSIFESFRHCKPHNSSTRRPQLYSTKHD